MAVRTRPTPHGEAINFVFVPPEARGKGHGRDLAAAMSRMMLMEGRRYCFIMTDAEDRRTHHIYFSIGARTVAVFLRCQMVPVAQIQASKHGPTFQISR